jgi:outer membrane protein TolC
MKLFRIALAAALLSFSGISHAQISFSAAVDLALRNSPRVKMAESEVNKARAVLAESHDVYIPSLTGGSGLGYTYGFPVGTPTLYSFTAQSLIFDQSQKNYIRAAREGLEASNLSLRDVRQAIAEDTAITYIILDADQNRVRALSDQFNSATRLVELVQARIDAGQDNHLELTRARRALAQIRLSRLLVDDDLDTQREHFMRLTGIASRRIETDTASIPAVPANLRFTISDGALSPAVQASYAIAQSRLQQAFGDARKMYRPQIVLAAQYNRFASFNNYQQYYCPDPLVPCQITNNVSFGIQLSLPIFDMNRRSHAHETMAEAQRSLHEADYARDQFLEGRRKASHAAAELAARAEVASLDRELAQDQLDIIRTQLTAGNPNGQAVTPKDEQNAIVGERQKYLDFLAADLQLRTAQINLLRASGQLEDWIKSSISVAPTTLPSIP